MALYNNGYPASYQQITIPQWQQMQQIQQQIPQLQAQAQAQPQMPVIPQQVINNTIVWVKSQKEAEDYLVAPNNSVVFMDEAMTHLYMKSADQFGRPKFSSKLLTDDTEKPSEPRREPETVDTEKYLTKEEFAAWIDESLEKRLSELRPQRQQKRIDNRHSEKRSDDE